MSLRVLIADDQELIRTGLRMILDAQPGIEVVGEAKHGREDLLTDIFSEYEGVSSIFVDPSIPSWDSTAAQVTVAPPLVGSTRTGSSTTSTSEVGS